jgi:hypothetical protein
MLTALILVCSLGTVSDLGNCTRDNALHVLFVPATFATPVSCLMHGQAYVADTSIGRELAQNEVAKVVCVRGLSTTGDKAEVSDWLKSKNSNAPAATREIEEDWGKAKRR